MNSDQANPNLEGDRRWRRLKNRPWLCPSCGKTHTGLFDIVCDKPHIWPDSADRISNSDLSPSSHYHFLSDDFCIFENEHYFVRCVLELPLLGGNGEFFAFGVWTSLSERNFALYAKSFSSDQGALGPWFGWFSNRLNGYPDTLNLKCHVHPRDDGRRPSIELEPTDHLLAREQRDGITFDRLLEIYDAHGHDLRRTLSDS
jgi:hypothetical protein